jgi:hypothetical protein
LKKIETWPLPQEAKTMTENLVRSAAAACGTKTPRRSGRVSVAVPILIIGSDAEGRVFSEETHTVVLSRHGAGIVSQYKLIASRS